MRPCVHRRRLAERGWLAGPPAGQGRVHRKATASMSWLVSGWMALGASAAKAALMYLVALVALRLAHRRALAQWTAIDFAAAVAVGAIIGRTAVAQTQSLAIGAVALISIIAAHALATLGHFHTPFAKLFEHPVRVIVDHGQLRRDQLRRCGLTETEVVARLREQGVGSLAELRYVLYEAKGELSIVPERGTRHRDPELVRRGLREAAGFRYQDSSTRHS